MTTRFEVTGNTNVKLWAAVFFIVCIPIGFIHLYPDQPLSVTWLMSPLIIAEGILSWDAQVAEHLGLMGEMFLLLLGSSWVIHCFVILAWKKSVR